jgi:hypothetical protein
VEGESILGQIVLIYVMVYIGLAILGIVIRDYRLVHYGTFSRQLTAEQIESIRCAIEEDHDLPAAVKRYREAAPDAGLAEAEEYVIRLFNSLRAKHPDKFVPPPLSQATLNWKVMEQFAEIEAVVLGVLWYAMPPSHPASAIAQFAYSFLFGIGLIAGLRVKGFWKRMLLLIPGLALMILSEAVVSRLAEAWSHSPGPYLGGFLFGILLMVSGFDPRTPEGLKP